jgi:hypothetical protein
MIIFVFFNFLDFGRFHGNGSHFEKIRTNFAAVAMEIKKGGI